jgi:hypothetical protein
MVVLTRNIELKAGPADGFNGSSQGGCGGRRCPSLGRDAKERGAGRCGADRGEPGKEKVAGGVRVGAAGRRVAGVKRR